MTNINSRRMFAAIIMKNVYSLILLVVMIEHSVLAATTLVDLTGPGCDKLDGYYLKNIDDFITIYAYPQYNTIATRDHCDVIVRADEGRRIEYLIENIYFNECGVEIRMFDNPTIDVNPLQTITCNDNSKVPIQGKTNFNVIRVRLRKSTPENRAFTFSMRLKNDLGPSMEFEKDSARYTGEVLEPGVIVGIALAGGVVIIAAIGVGIFLCLRARNDNLKKKQYPADSTSNNHSSNIEVSVSVSHRQKYEPRTLSHSYKESMNQWSVPENRPPRRPKPPIPMPTQPSQRDPGRKGLSDRHRSGENVVGQSSQTRHTNRRGRETFA